jgi:hypothetical protein
LTAQHVSRDIIAHHQELLNCNYSFWFYSRLSLPAAVIAEFQLSHDSGRQKLLMMSDNIARKMLSNQ